VDTSFIRQQRPPPFLPHRAGAPGAELNHHHRHLHPPLQAYLGILPHFHLWRHFFELKKTSKGAAIGSVGFMFVET
jgi:hypothetical protein